MNDYLLLGALAVLLIVAIAIFSAKEPTKYIDPETNIVCYHKGYSMSCLKP